MSVSDKFISVVGTKLQLSNGYLVHFDQLARLLDAVCRDERPRISRTDLETAVGLANRKVENLCSIAQGLGLLQPITYRATPLGEVVRQHDPFFDDLGTLWFLHFAVSSEPRFMIWNHFANQVVPRRRSFTRAELADECAVLAEGHSRYTVQNHVRNEAKSVLDAYTTQNFSRLAYLREDGEGYIPDYREPVPPLVLAAAIVRFRDRHRPGDTGVNVADLIAAPNSPGVVFQLTEDRFRTALEQLKTEPGLSVESRADLDQVRLTDGTPDSTWMERYYARR
jgi:hypothetical protein